ncbi:MAG: hypothetical protein J7M26_02615, partial [Armatimonadetes bacterium]|nr:hypothetical protein [Armatimonadota bacterium]
WDLLADHPLFSPEERLELDRKFLYILQSREGPGRIEGEAKQNIIRNNHGTRTALDAYFGGRYFLRRYGVEDGRRWMDLARRYFKPQLTSAKPICDSWGHQWNASLFNTLVYALADGREDYLQSEALRLAADRALIAHPNAAGPLGYLSACAVATGDSGYLSGYGSAERRGRLGAAMTSRGDEYLRAFSTGEPLTERDDLLGVAVAPLDKLWYETIDAAGMSAGGLFKTTIPPEQGFDKISIRESWGPADFYLLFDGISGGLHSFQDANCIVRLTEADANWFPETYTTSSASTVREQNGVLWLLDGSGPGSLHRFARQLYAGQQGDFLAAAGALDGLGDAAWQRHILRRRGRWTVVLDRVVALKAGELLVERHWHLAGKVEPTPYGLRAVQSVNGRSVELRLHLIGAAPDGLSVGNHCVEKVRAQVQAGQAVELACLIESAEADEPVQRSLSREGAAWLVHGPDGARIISAAGNSAAGLSVEAGTTRASFGTATPAAAATSSPQTLPLQPELPEARLTWRRLPVSSEPVVAVTTSADGRVAAAAADGLVVVFNPGGEELFRAHLPARPLSLHFYGDGLLSGDEKGTLLRLAADGHVLWKVTMPYVPIPWPYWSEQRSSIREIDSLDMDGDGQEEIVVSNGDRRVYWFSADGRQLWKASVEWGVYTAMTAGTYQGKPAVFGGTSRPSMHGWCIVFGAGGKLLGHYLRPDLISWSIPCQFRDMRLSDLDADGQPEVINAVHTNCRQLIVYSAEGKVQWDADMGGAALALAVVKTGKGSQVCCSGASAR